MTVAGVSHFGHKWPQLWARVHLSTMASRKTMNISLPPAMKKWVDQQVKARGFGTSSEFVRHVLREAWESNAVQDVESKLLEGLASGPSTPMTDGDWERIRREGKRRLAAAKVAGAGRRGRGERKSA